MGNDNQKNDFSKSAKNIFNQVKNLSKTVAQKATSSINTSDESKEEKGNSKSSVETKNSDITKTTMNFLKQVKDKSSKTLGEVIKNGGSFGETILKDFKDASFDSSNMYVGSDPENEFREKIIQKAILNNGKIVLPEGFEERTIQAARIILDENIAKEVVLIGDEEEIQKKAKSLNVNLKNIIIENPKNSENIEQFAKELYELRKTKGMTEEEAHQKIQNFLSWGAMRVHLGLSDTMVAGAFSTTADVLRNCFQIVKTAPGVKKASSCFVMITNKKEYGANGQFIFADCSTIPNPDSETLAEIAIQSAKSCKTFLETDPVIALLSYSTKGSAAGEMIDKVQQALQIVKNEHPELKNIDGELQLDAAIVPEVGKMKAKDSKVAGKANVLIFPDLQSGNIGYKLVQRLCDAAAYGPILQGFKSPVSDLSRGCSVEDIVMTSALTLSQLSGKNKMVFGEAKEKI